VNADSPWRLHDYITWALWPIPIATRVKIILAMPADPRTAAGDAVDHITWTILRTWAPTISVPVRAAVPMIVAGATVTTTWPRRLTATLPVLVVVTLPIILVVTLARL
jgi:hypothetical protein